MKLVYYALTVGAIASVEARRRGVTWSRARKTFYKKRTENQDSFLCKTEHDSFFNKGPFDLEEYNKTIDEKLAAYAETLADETSIDDHCVQALESDICVQFNELSLEEIEARFASEFPKGSDCGEKAAKWINQITLCQTCTNILEEAAVEEGMAELANRNIANEEVDIIDSWSHVMISNVPDPEKMGATLKAHGMTASEYSQIVDPLTSDSKNITENEDKMNAMVQDNGVMFQEAMKSVEGIQSIQSTKSFFRKLGRAVWNVVVSGGPEYCKDMLPKFPKITLPKSHTNYPTVEKLKNNCVLMHSIIKGTKCFCGYVLWGCDEFKSVDRCNAQWQRKTASNTEKKYCWYFSNLKGGIYKPQRKPMNPTCHTFNIPVDMLFEKKRCPFKNRKIRRKRCPKWKPRRTYAECREAREWYCSNHTKKTWLVRRCHRNMNAESVEKARDWCDAQIPTVLWDPLSKMQADARRLNQSG